MKIKMVYWQNNGVIAAMVVPDYEIYKSLQRRFDIEVNGAAHNRGVRWFTFISYHRFMNMPELAALVTGTYANWNELTAHVAVAEQNIYVPFSNGPAHWLEEKKFSARLSVLTARLGKVSGSSEFALSVIPRTHIGA